MYVLHIDELAKRHTAKMREARLEEQALFAELVFRNGWRITKTSAFYAWEFTALWLTIQVPLFAWSGVLEGAVRYAVFPGWKIGAVGLGVFLYAHVFRATKKRFFDKWAKKPIEANMSPPLAADTTEAAKPPPRTSPKNLKTRISHTLRLVARLLRRGKEAMWGWLVVYRLVFVAGGIALTAYTLFQPESFLGTTYFARANAWAFHHLFAHFGVRPNDLISALHNLKGDLGPPPDFEQRFYVPLSNG